MAERIAPGPVSNIKDCEAVCIHTKKIYDSCRDKDIASYKNLSNKKQLRFHYKFQLKIRWFCLFVLCIDNFFYNRVQQGVSVRRIAVEISVQNGSDIGSLNRRIIRPCLLKTLLCVFTMLLQIAQLFHHNGHAFTVRWEIVFTQFQQLMQSRFLSICGNKLFSDCGQCFFQRR